MTNKKSSGANKVAQGNAAQLLVASELNRRGWSAAVTLGNAPHVDVLCSNECGTKFAFVQVKSFHLMSKSCTVGIKAENAYANNFFWVIVGLSDEPDTRDSFFIVPAQEMARNVMKLHKEWLATSGRNGQQHNDNTIRKVCVGNRKYEYDISQWGNRWDLFENILK
jgi:hypothetical protein